VDAHGMPLRAVITQGTTADCAQAVALIDGFEVEDKSHRKSDEKSFLIQAFASVAHSAEQLIRNRFTSGAF
jgi:hypothetical protein